MCVGHSLTGYEIHYEYVLCISVPLNIFIHGIDVALCKQCAVINS